MDNLYANIVNQIVAEDPNIKPKQGYELFLQQISLLDEESMKAAGFLTEAQIKSKISSLKRVGIVQTSHALLGFKIK